jgi:glyoxylase-like metal-dependent hydrolase (beta-lactamase superfamily II)
MHRWRIGDVDIVRIEDDAFALPSDRPAPAWAVPDFAPTRDEVAAAFSAIAIADGPRRIVVDPWLANDGPRTRPGAAERVAGLLDQLARAGFATDDVDTVVNSHFDGIGWNTRPADDGADSWVPTFPNARYLYPRAEIEAWQAGRFPPADDGFARLDAHGVLDPVDPPVELTPHIRLDDAPGHAFGHLAVRVESQGRLAVLAGHLILNPFQLGDPTEASDLDAATATASRRRLLAELADRDGVLVTTLLGGPGGGHVRRDGDGYLLEV